MASEASRGLPTSSSTSATATKALASNAPGSGLRLGGARADFVAGLGRKVQDLRATSAKVREAPEDFARREELRRKMHALSSAAKLMKFDAMDRAIAEALGTIDRTAVDVPLELVDLDAIDQVLEDLPALAWGDGDARVSRIEAVAKPAEPTYSALVIGSAHIAEALLDDPPRASDSADGSTQHVTFACESTPDAQAAFDLARTTEPDLIILDGDLDYAIELVEALMDEPLTEGAPIVVVGSFLEAGESARYVAMGVAKTLAKPTSKITLRNACETALEARAASLPRVPVIGKPTAASAAAGQNVQDAAFGDRARVRLRGPATEVKLTGRRVLVADDDPAVVWFLADLLKASGCIVHEAFDGKQALELAYSTSPDLLICDIMMPELDGFALCRTLRRDVALHDVPVILLSWKEDLLQRVRELGAGAAGYIRKETDTRAIVARVREALRPRSRIETRLREDGEVRGRMDGVSTRTLLEIVCATRPSARVTIRDASFSYELEIRDGAPLRATRTSGDGTCLEGPRVIAAMLGVGAGRFTVTTSTTTVEAQLDGNLAAQLAKPIARARAATAILTGAATVRADHVNLDEEMLDDYLRAMPEQAKKIALRIASGTSPRSLILEGNCSASLVEDLVCDLAARGIVTAIENDMGEDILAPEVARIAAYTDTRAAFAPRTATPEPGPAGADAIARMPVAGACAGDNGLGLCESPEPGGVNRADGDGAGASLEDAVMREIAFRSPEPAPLGLPLDRALMVEPSSLRPRTSPPAEPYEPYEHEGTPPHDQILAMAEATVIDDTTYAEREAAEVESAEAEAPERAIPIDEASEAMLASESRAMKTPLTAVTTREDERAGLPSKTKTWPMIAFVAAGGVVAWAVLHFSSAVTSPKQVEAPQAPPAQSIAAKNEATTYTSTVAENDVAAGHGLLEISAPGDSVILVDGTERGRGGATLPLWDGVHDVRVSGIEGDQHRAVEVRAGHVAHIKF
jgi:DNA-binding response OmpR family regulator